MARRKLGRFFFGFEMKNLYYLMRIDNNLRKKDEKFAFELEGKRENFVLEK